MLNKRRTTSAAGGVQTWALSRTMSVTSTRKASDPGNKHAVASGNASGTSFGVREDHPTDFRNAGICNTRGRRCWRCPLSLLVYWGLVRGEHACRSRHVRWVFVSAVREIVGQLRNERPVDRGVSATDHQHGQRALACDALECRIKNNGAVLGRAGHVRDLLGHCAAVEDDGVRPSFDEFLVFRHRLTLALLAVEHMPTRVKQGHDPVSFFVELQCDRLDLF